MHVAVNICTGAGFVSLDISRAVKFHGLAQKWRFYFVR